MLCILMSCVIGMVIEWYSMYLSLSVDSSMNVSVVVSMILVFCIDLWISFVDCLVNLWFFCISMFVLCMILVYVGSIFVYVVIVFLCDMWFFCIVLFSSGV